MGGVACEGRKNVFVETVFAVERVGIGLDPVDPSSEGFLLGDGAELSRL